MAPLVDLADNSAAKCDIAGDITFEARELRLSFIHPEGGTNVFERSREACRGLVVWVGLKQKFGERARAMRPHRIGPRFPPCPGHSKRLYGSVHEFHMIVLALFKFREILFVAF